MYSAACLPPLDFRLPYLTMFSVFRLPRSTCGALSFPPRTHTGRRLTTMLLYTIYINAAVNVRITLNVLKQRHCLSRGLERATNFLLGHQRA